jgi:hypothetical protein
MNSQSAFTFSAIAAIGLALLPSNLSAQQGTITQQLIGAWTIVSWQDTAPQRHEAGDQKRRSSRLASTAGVPQ